MVADTRSTLSEDVRSAEIEFILGAKPASDPALWGLALSGGGIRSATFALGVLQVLARRGMLGAFHYLSTISGGGYAGAFVQGLIRRRGQVAAFRVLSASIRDKAAPAGNSSQGDKSDGGSDEDLYRPLLHLREYSNYLSPRKSPLSGDTLGMFGTYLRNVLLVQIQLCALLAALSLIPVLMYALLAFVAARWPLWLLCAAALLGLASGALIGWVSKHANRSRGTKATQAATAAMSAGNATRDCTARPPLVAPATVLDVREAPRRGLVAAAAFAMVLLALAALAGAVGLWGANQLPPAWRDPFFGWPTDVLIPVFTGLFYLVTWLSWLLLDGQTTQKRRFLFATFVSAALVGLALLAAKHAISPWHDRGSFWHAMIIAPTLVLSAITFAAIVHIGLAGPALNDLHREIWARIGGKAIAFVVLGIGLTLAVTIYGPMLVMYGLNAAEGFWRATGWIGVVGWIVTSLSGLMAAYSQRVGNPASHPRYLDLLARVAPWVFILGFLVVISHAAQYILSLTGALATPANLREVMIGKSLAQSANIYLSLLAGTLTDHSSTILLVIAGAGAIWLAFAYLIDHNECSLNAFYRNRLVRCYLGASNAKRNAEAITNFDPADDIPLDDLVARPDRDVVDSAREAARNDSGASTTKSRQRPLFPLIGTALNLVAAKQLDWQDRKAASFCLTPGYCGYMPPPSHCMSPPVGDACAAIGATAPATGPQRPPAIASTLKLGDAIAISGAAVSPNMGYHSSPAVTFLLALFDIRLGWWLPNPGYAKKAVLPAVSGVWLIAEMLGLSRDGGRNLYLSDGGHFENLGIYELIRRRCRFVLCVDSSADPDREFADLGNAVQKCRTDFGVDIRIDVSGLRPDASGVSSRACAMGTINYPGEEAGVLLYLKPSLTTAEPADVAYYARAHPSFPHEPTSDQYFDEAQFESYRRLGECVAISAIEPALERACALHDGPDHDIGLGDSDLRDRVLIELQHLWTPPAPALDGRFAEHAERMSKLFAQLRATPALAVLDAQIYPSWIDLVRRSRNSPNDDSAVPVVRRTRLPDKEHFRACFYFCQELIQLMEAVYHDLRLERAWNHPDNRGWMNMFRHWSWAPIFRIAWAVGAPTFGRSFVSFCELRLDMPRLSDVVRAEEDSPGNIGWPAHCDALAGDGRVNHVEHSILVSEPITRESCAEKLRIFLMKLDWKAVVQSSDEGRPDDTTCGVAVLCGNTLRMLRVQDHLRQMGLGLAFMRSVAAVAHDIEVDVPSGDYGLVGNVTPEQAESIGDALRSLLAKARAI